MTYYQRHVEPRLHEQSEWQALTARIAEQERRLEELRTQRANFVSAFVARMLYPTAED